MTDPAEERFRRAWAGNRPDYERGVDGRASCLDESSINQYYLTLQVKPADFSAPPGRRGGTKLQGYEDVDRWIEGCRDAKLARNTKYEQYERRNAQLTIRSQEDEPSAFDALDMGGGAWAARGDRTQEILQRGVESACDAIGKDADKKREGQRAHDSRRSTGKVIRAESAECFASHLNSGAQSKLDKGKRVVSSSKLRLLSASVRAQNSHDAAEISRRQSDSGSRGEGRSLVRTRADVFRKEP
ncbi:hypothetical protein FB451DRAFT_1190327 [Mycena latifolia]|nr:hypothetical protein FB451DRAFT_1190327 [Mycena latifolia]